MISIKHATSAAACAVALIAGPATAAHATDYGVNMNQACQIQYGAGWRAELTYPGQGAYGWRCWVPPFAPRKGVSVQGYCTYFGLGTAITLNPADPYSWRCRT